jgi:hypothetical protein
MRFAPQTIRAPGAVLPGCEVGTTYRTIVSLIGVAASSRNRMARRRQGCYVLDMGTGIVRLPLIWADS